ncbi:MAG: DUF1295 domain-containing protein [Brevinema sp.]
MIFYIGVSALTLWIIFSLTYFIAIKNNKWAVIDTTWGLGFPLISFLGWILNGFSFQSLSLVILPAIWGIRLAWHIAVRNAPLSEDPRYAKIKAGYNGNYSLAYFQVFLFQGFIMFIMCFPFYFYFPTQNFSILNILPGLIICIIGLYWEITADAQLAYFIKNEKIARPNQSIDTGLWAYSRHPNYFGEITFWVGIWLCTVPSLFSQGMILLIILGLISPILIGLTISMLTGPMLEEHMKKYSNWEEYSKHTPYIFPFIKR